MKPTRKHEIRRAVRKRTAEYLDIDPGQVFEHGVCLYVSHFLCEELADRNLTPLLQVGTALWKYREHPTGTTHVGYEWNSPPNDLLWRTITKQVLRGGLMPEFHSWVVIRETKTVIDLCLPRFYQLASVLDNDGEKLTLPRELWTSSEDVPSQAKYSPDLKATAFGLVCITNTFGIPDYFPQTKQFCERFLPFSFAEMGL